MICLGPFDILPRHANLIALVQNTPIKILLEDKKKLEYIFPMAIIYNLKKCSKNLYRYFGSARHQVKLIPELFFS
jgi:hypothetical protein